MELDAETAQRRPILERAVEWIAGYRARGQVKRRRVGGGDETRGARQDRRPRPSAAIFGAQDEERKLAEEDAGPGTILAHRPIHHAAAGERPAIDIAESWEWAVPGGYTIADPYLLFYYRAAKFAGVPMEERFPVWTALSGRVMARPSVQRVLKKEAEALAGGA